MQSFLCENLKLQIPGSIRLLLIVKFLNPTLVHLNKLCSVYAFPNFGKGENTLHGVAVRSAGVSCKRGVSQFQNRNWCIESAHMLHEM